MRDHKVNGTITKLYLERNGIGDAGAVALAEAIRAPLVMYCVVYMARTSTRHGNVCIFFGSKFL